MTDQRGAQRTGSREWPPLHPWAWLGALVLYGLALGSDAMAQRSDRQYVDAHRAWSLIGWGTLVTVVAVVLFIAHLASLDAQAKRRALPYLIPLDLTLLWFAFSYIERRSTSLVPTDTWKLVVSGVVGLISFVGLVLEVRRLRAGRVAVTAAPVVDSPIES